MKRVFIGHRGVGKTSLLNRHKIYFPEIPHFDLDEEIQKNVSMEIKTYFEKHGEAKFRQIERSVFERLTSEYDQFVISVGGGFNPIEIIDDIQVIFVQRSSDLQGRIFLNRPSLNPELPPLEEYFERYHQRQPLFLKRADFIYDMSEGILSANEIEKKVFSFDFSGLNGFVTLIKDKSHLVDLFDQVELRTDHWTFDEIEELIKKYPSKKFLVSYRSPTDLFLKSNQLQDWAMELGDIPMPLENSPQSENLIVSSHHDNIDHAITELSKYNRFHLKLCPVVNNWEQLELGYQWQCLDPERRSFLPRTPKSTSFPLWKWFRELMIQKQKINFISCFSDYIDQPSLYDFFKSHSFKSDHGFGAVLGYPVNHSKTPEFHQHELSLNFYQVPIQESDFENGFQFLNQTGLKFAAVTSPLKEKAAKSIQKVGAINSLKKIENEWKGTSTDEFGFQKLMDQIPNMKTMNIVIWGGGGVLESLKKILPQAITYSARAGRPRDYQKSVSEVDLLIWAAPRRKEIQYPPEAWNPKMVLDINYQDYSMGKEYALRKNIQYISGDLFFRTQAMQQQKFFKGEF